MPSRAARLRRIHRLRHPRVWKTLLLALTEPENDNTWDFVLRTGTAAYLDQPTPWLAPEATKKLHELAKPGVRVLEWGAGSSTLWLLSRDLQVTALETDPQWASVIKQRVGDRGQVQLVARSDYLPRLNDYDIVIIDGPRRVECADHVFRERFRGLVIWDDTHRAAYQDKLWEMADRAKKHRHYATLSPQLTPKMTSLFWL